MPEPAKASHVTQNKPNWVDVMTLLVLFATFMAVIWYACEAHRQAIATEDAARATATAAQAAQQGIYRELLLDIPIMEFADIQAGPKLIAGGQAEHVVMEFQNIGRRFATNVRPRIGWWLIDPQTKTLWCNDFVPPPKSFPSVKSGGMKKIAVQFTLDRDRMKAVEAGTMKFMIKGEILNSDPAALSGTKAPCRWLCAPYDPKNGFTIDRALVKCPSPDGYTFIGNGPACRSDLPCTE